MTSRWLRWLLPGVGLLVGFLVAFLVTGRNVSAGPSRPASVLEAILGMALVVAFLLAMWFLDGRSEAAMRLTGREPDERDERLESINRRALARTAQVMALILLGALIVANLAGGDTRPFAAFGAVLAMEYMGCFGWYRWRS
jgi:hypothetical protein